MVKFGRRASGRRKVFNVRFLPAQYIHAFKDIVSILNKKKINYMFVGALPVNVYGRERTTRDIDVVLVAGKKELNDIFPSFRYSLVYPDNLDVIKNVAKFRDRKTSILIDVLLNPEEFTFTSETFNRKQKVMVGKSIGFVPSAEDYVVSKLKAARAGSSDFQDIVSVLMKNKEKIDWIYLERRAKEENKLYLLSYYKELVKA